MPNPKSIPHAGPGIEGDWVWVPREPTEAMISAAANSGRFNRTENVRSIYRAALSSAPQRPSESIETDGPHPITDARRWLSRQLRDSKLSDEEAFGIVAYHPAIRAQQPSGGWRPDPVEIAKIIAKTAIGIRLDDLMLNRTEWVSLRGSKNGYDRDVNDPFQSDVCEAASAILALPSPPVGDHPISPDQVVSMSDPSPPRRRAALVAKS